MFRAAATTLLVMAPLAGGAVAPAATRAPTPRVGVDAANAPTAMARNARARALGVRYVRTSAVRLGHPTQERPKPLDAALRAGFRLVLNVNNQPGGASTPAVPPTDLAAYRTALDRTLVRYHPALLVVENEELAPKFYSGTPRQYLAQLAAAVSVAHKRHRLVTNGGIVDGAVILLTWRDLWVRGHHAEADAFIRNVQDGRPLARRIRNDIPDSQHPHRAILAHHVIPRVLLARARELIRGFRASKMDYVNFHWYQSGPKPFGQAVAYLRRATHKRAVTNEIGQFDSKGSTVTELLRAALKLRLPFTVWYGGDGNPAVGLFEPDDSLRPNGVAFRDFLAAHPSAR